MTLPQPLREQYERCPLCGIERPEHRQGVNADHQFSDVDPGGYRFLVGLLRIGDVDARQTHLGGNIWGVRIDYPTTQCYALITDSEVPPQVGYDLGFYVEGPHAEPLEFHEGWSVSQILNRIKQLPEDIE